MRNKTIWGGRRQEQRARNLEEIGRSFLFLYRDHSDKESSENRCDRLQCRHAVFPRYQPERAI